MPRNAIERSQARPPNDSGTTAIMAIEPDSQLQCVTPHQGSLERAGGRAGLPGLRGTEHTFSLPGSRARRHEAWAVDGLDMGSGPHGRGQARV